MVAPSWRIILINAYEAYFTSSAWVIKYIIHKILFFEALKSQSPVSPVRAA